MAVRGLLGIPAIPSRIDENVEQIKQLIGELLATEDELVRSTRATNETVQTLHTVVAQLADATEEFRTINRRLESVDRRIEAMQLDIRKVATAVEDVAEHLPRKEAGPLDKVKDVLAGGNEAG